MIKWLKFRQENLAILTILNWKAVKRFCTFFEITRQFIVTSNGRMIERERMNEGEANISHGVNKDIYDIHHVHRCPSVDV